MESFTAFHFDARIAQAITDAGYTAPTPIQVQAIPPILNSKDIIGIAQTGTGKTAAFVLPLLQHMVSNPKQAVRGMPRVLVLVPTRELAAQVAASFATYGKHLSFTYLTLFGGVPQGPQVHTLSKAVDVIIATPGRLLDLMRQGHVKLSAVETLVLDEADRMLEMGFAEDIKLLAHELPQDRQTLLFSATFSGRIASLAHTYQKNPLRVTITAEGTTVGKTVQTVYFVDKEDKMRLLLRVLADKEVKRAIVFVRMKHTADRIVAKLAAESVAAEALHSDKTQAMRTTIMDTFRAGKIRVLIATDIAARGIDVDDITHVVNFDLPKDPETYVHRIGRTARAGTAGIAISFCCAEDYDDLMAIEKLINKKLTVKEHKYHSSFAQSGGVISHAQKAKPTSVHHGKSKVKAGHKARKSIFWKQK